MVLPILFLLLCLVGASDNIRANEPVTRKWWFIVLMVCFGVILIAVVIGFTYLCYRRRKCKQYLCVCIHIGAIAKVDQSVNIFTLVGWGGGPYCFVYVLILMRWGGGLECFVYVFILMGLGEGL